MVSGALVRHAECGASMRPCKDLCIPRCIHTHICHHQVCTHITTWCVCTHTHTHTHTRLLPPGVCTHTTITSAHQGSATFRNRRAEE